MSSYKSRLNLYSLNGFENDHVLCATFVVLKDLNFHELLANLCGLWLEFIFRVLKPSEYKLFPAFHVR
jgi:hypothetical protein